VYRRRVPSPPPIHIPTADEINAFFIREFPAAHASGNRCMETGPGFVVSRWTYDRTTLRPGGFISGPTQFALADTGLWFLSFTVLGLAPMAVTSEINIAFLRPAVGGDLWARAEMLHAGKHKIVGTVRLWVDGAPDKPVSHAVGSYMQIA
jgi:uncharacterized protein (TIGR00369 family)